MFSIRYASIRELDISNGENVGVSLFVQGCSFHCPQCFNIDTWDFDGGKEWTTETKYKFFELINRPYIKRISILGGEPLANENVEDVLKLVNEIRVLFPDKSIWLYTGYTWEEFFDNSSYKNNERIQALKYCDVLIDGRYIDSQHDLTLKWCGSLNQRVIDVQRSLKKGEIVLYEN